jgi:hypothetical protein
MKKSGENFGNLPGFLLMQSKDLYITHQIPGRFYLS